MGVWTKKILRTSCHKSDYLFEKIGPISHTFSKIKNLHSFFLPYVRGSKHNFGKI